MRLPAVCMRLMSYRIGSTSRSSMSYLLIASVSLISPMNSSLHCCICMLSYWTTTLPLFTNIALPLTYSPTDFCPVPISQAEVRARQCLRMLLPSRSCCTHWWVTRDFWFVLTAVCWVRRGRARDIYREGMTSYLSLSVVWIVLRYVVFLLLTV